MRKHLKELGRKLQVECPDNDCRVFLNVFEMLEGVEDDLVGYTLSEWGKKVLQMERQRLEHELGGMFFTNYAVRQFRNQKYAENTPANTKETKTPLQEPQAPARDEYKVTQLKQMLLHETSEMEVHYGARLKHHATNTAVLTIDAGGLQALIDYYSTHETNLGGGAAE